MARSGSSATATVVSGYSSRCWMFVSLVACCLLLMPQLSSPAPTPQNQQGGRGGEAVTTGNEPPGGQIHEIVTATNDTSTSQFSKRDAGSPRSKPLQADDSVQIPADQEEPWVYNVVMRQQNRSTRQRSESAYISPDVDWLRELVPRLAQVLDESDKNIREAVVSAVERQREDNRQQVFVNVVKSSVLSEAEVPDILDQLQELIKTGKTSPATHPLADQEQIQVEGRDGGHHHHHHHHHDVSSSAHHPGHERQPELPLVKSPRPLIVNIIIFNVIADPAASFPTPGATHANVNAFDFEGDSYLEAYHLSHGGKQQQQQRPSPSAVNIGDQRTLINTASDQDEVHQERNYGYGYGVPFLGPPLTNRPLTVMEQDYAALHNQPTQDDGDQDDSTGLLRPPSVEAVVSDEDASIQQASLFFTSLAELQPSGDRPPVEAIQVEGLDPPALAATPSVAATSTASNTLRNRIRTYGFVAVPLMAGLAGTAGMWLPAVAAFGRRRRKRSPASSIEPNFHPFDKLAVNGGDGQQEQLDMMAGRAIDSEWLSLLMGKRYSEATKQELKDSIDNWKYRDQEAENLSYRSPNVFSDETKSESIYNDPVASFSNIDSVISSLNGPDVNPPVTESTLMQATSAAVNERRITGSTMPSPPKSSTYHLLPVPSSGDFDIVANFVKSALSDMVDQDRELINNDVFVINTPTIVNGSALLISSADVVGPATDAVGSGSNSEPKPNKNSATGSSSFSSLSAVNVFSRDPIKPANMNKTVANSPVTFVTTNPRLPVVSSQAKSTTASTTTTKPPTTVLDFVSTARTGLSSTTKRLTRPTKTTTTTPAPFRVTSTTERNIASINQDYEMDEDMFNEELYGVTYDRIVSNEVPLPTIPYSEPFIKSTRHPLPPNMYINPNEVPSTIKPMVPTWFPTSNWWFSLATTPMPETTTTPLPTTTTTAESFTSTQQTTTSTSRSRTRPTTSRRKTSVTAGPLSTDAVSSSTLSSRPSTLITIQNFQPLPPPVRVSSEQHHPPPPPQSPPPAPTKKQQHQQQKQRPQPFQQPLASTPELINPPSNSYVINSTALKITHGLIPTTPTVEDEAANPDGESALVSVVVQNQHFMANLLKGPTSTSTERPTTRTTTRRRPSHSTTSRPPVTPGAFTSSTSSNYGNDQWPNYSTTSRPQTSYYPNSDDGHGHWPSRPSKRPHPIRTTVSSSHSDSASITTTKPRPPAIEPIVAEFMEQLYDFYSTARYPSLPPQTSTTTSAPPTTTTTPSRPAFPFFNFESNISNLYGQNGNDNLQAIYGGSHYGVPSSSTSTTTTTTTTKSPGPPSTTSNVGGLHFVNSSTEIVVFSGAFEVTPSSVFDIEPLPSIQFNPMEEEHELEEEEGLDFSPLDADAQLPPSSVDGPGPASSTSRPPLQIEAVVAEEHPLNIEAVLADGPPIEAIYVETAGDNGESELNPAPITLVNTNANQLSVSAGSGASGLSSVSGLVGSSSSSTTGTSSANSVLAPGVVIGSLAVAIAATATIVAAVFFPTFLPLAALGKKRRTYYDPPRTQYVAASKQSFAEPPPNYHHPDDEYFEEDQHHQEEAVDPNSYYPSEESAYQPEEEGEFYQNEVGSDPLHDPLYYYSDQHNQQQQQQIPNQLNLQKDIYGPPAQVYLNARRRRRDVHKLRLRKRH